MTVTQQSLMTNGSSDFDRFISLPQDERLDILRHLFDMGYDEHKLRQLFKEVDLDQLLEQYPEYRVHKLLVLYVPPFLVIFGSFGNLFSFLILRHTSMKQQSIYIYLSTLAIFDTLVLIIGLLRQWLGEVTGSDLRNQSPWLCKLTVTLGYACSDISTWLIVAVTVERYIAVCHPLRANQFCKGTRAKKIVVAIILMFLASNSHLLYGTDLEPIKQDVSGSQDEQGEKVTSYVCGAAPGYEKVVHVVWPWVDALFYGFGPFVLLTFFNSFILHKVFQAKRSRAQLLNGRYGNSPPSDPSNVRMTVMLLAVSFTFLLTTLPMNVAIIIAHLISKDTSPRVRARGVLFSTLATLLMYLNHSVNFLLYCATGRKFRSVVFRSTCARLQQRTRPSDHSQHLYCSRKCSGLRYLTTDIGRSSQESQV